MKHLLLICFSALTLSSFGWETLGRIEALEEEHSVLCSPSINHGAPILHLSLRNLHDGERISVGPNKINGENRLYKHYAAGFYRYF